MVTKASTDALIWRCTDPTGLKADPPGWGFPGVCTLVEFQIGVNLGSAHGWRYAHCMTSCRIKRFCGAMQSTVAQNLKEYVWDMTACLALGRQGNCDSWGQQSDFDDNARGFTCPAGQSCVDRCEPLLDAPETPPGPFWWTGCFIRGQCGPMTVLQRTWRR